MCSEFVKIKDLKEDHDEFLNLLKLSPTSKTRMIDHYSCCQYCNCDCIAESARRDRKCEKDGNNNNSSIPSKMTSKQNQYKEYKPSSGGRDDAGGGCGGGGSSGSKRKKSKKPKRPKSVNTSRSYTKECAILNELLNLELPKHAQLHTPKNQQQNKSKIITGNNNNKKSELPLGHAAFPAQDDFNDLCTPMKNLCLSPRVRKAIKKIPVHDRRILNRMAKRRNERAILNENAYLAQQLWEHERYERDLLKYIQEEEYKRAIKEKHVFDNEMTKARVDALMKRKQEEIAQLKCELYEKDCKLQNRLKNIKLDKAIKIYQRNQDAFRKIEAVKLTQDELDCDNALKQQDICDRYENRLIRAECNRNQNMNSYLNRIKHTNYMQQILHEENYKEIEKFELIRKQQLKDEIEDKMNRADEFVKRKQKDYDELLERAKISSSLRDLVRSSVSPVGNQQYLNSMQQNSTILKAISERPISDLSFQSSVRLG